MHFDCRNLNGTALLQSLLITSCWLYTWELTNSNNKFAADLNMKGISFFYSHCITVASYACKCASKNWHVEW